MSDYSPKLTRTERQLVTQYCIRWPATKAEWFDFARSGEAQQMIEEQVGRRLRVARVLTVRLQCECNPDA